MELSRPLRLRYHFARLLVLSIMLIGYIVSQLHTLTFGLACQFKLLWEGYSLMAGSGGVDSGDDNPELPPIGWPEPDLKFLGLC